MQNAKEFLFDNLPWVISIAAVVFIVIVCLGLVFIWLRSRGKFMFLHCVVLNTAEVAKPWTKYAGQGNSLFVFMLVLAILSFVCFIPMAAVVVFVGIAMASSGLAVPIGILSIAGAVLIMIIMGIIFGLIGKFTKDFVVPIMYIHGLRCTQAWSNFLNLLKANKGRFALYILFQIVLGMAIGAIIFAAVICTCCCAGCIFMIPYIQITHL